MKQKFPARPHQDTDELRASEDFYNFHGRLTGKREGSKAGSVNNSRWPNGVDQEVNKTVFTM